MGLRSTGPTSDSPEASAGRPRRVLMVLTSHGTLGDTGRATGFWLEEFAAPYYVLTDAGVDVSLCSPLGGQPPIDPSSDEPGGQTDATRRFHADVAVQDRLATTLPLADLSAAEFDAVFYPGGHGPLWDLPDNRASIDLIEAFVAAGKPVTAVCHAPVAFAQVTNPDGSRFLAGRDVTAFSDSEEAAVGLTDVVPELLEDMLVAAGANYSKGPTDFGPYVVVDDGLITGQNPASSAPAARALLAQLEPADHRAVTSA